MNLQDWIINGLVVSIILTSIFLFVKTKKPWQYPAIILIVAMLYSYLIQEGELNKQWLAYFIGNLGFSVAFYELAGKYVVRNYFKGYKKDKAHG